jgi:DNA-binding MarR family transcriptional regulator
MTPGDDTERRIALAWRELRRGATGVTLRAHLLGPGGPPLEQAQLDALEILAAEHGGWRMGAFAEALRVDPSTATRAINRLEQLGLAERTRADGDQRVVIARATSQGRRTIERIVRLRALGMERLLDAFDQAERVQFADYLERFAASIDQLVNELTRQH